MLKARPPISQSASQEASCRRPIRAGNRIDKAASFGLPTLVLLSQDKSDTEAEGLNMRCWRTSVACHGPSGPCCSPWLDGGDYCNVTLKGVKKTGGEPYAVLKALRIRMIFCAWAKFRVSQCSCECLLNCKARCWAARLRVSRPCDRSQMVKLESGGRSGKSLSHLSHVHPCRGCCTQACEPGAP
jgi:hypothetical protein